MTTLYDIDRFCDYFTAQVSAINNLEAKSITEESITRVRLYKKTLTISAIDTLASLRFSKENYKELNKLNKARFIRFLSEYCEWENGTLISIPTLFDQLSIKKPQNSILYDALRNKLLKYNGNEGKALNIEIIDAKAEKLLELANSEIEEHLILECQHYSLLYGYKNCIAQEAREPCGVMEAYQYAQPHYYSYIQYKTADELTQWHLSYPVEHFKNLFFCSIKNMKQYFIKSNINPYSLLGNRHSRWW
jgi:hypothetical protein